VNSLYDHISNSEIQLFPVPAVNSVNLIIPDGNNGNAVIFNLQGNQIARIPLTGGENTIDISNLTPGVYTIYINSVEIAATRKLAVTR
jgi:hypothetical protein